MYIPQIAVLSNPGSTQNKRHLGKIRQVLDGSRNVFHFELDGVESIPEALAQFNRTKPILIVISGGDGTVQATLSAICNSQIMDEVPPLAILPSGKTNMIARDLGLGGKPHLVLKRLIETAQSGQLSDHVIRKFLIEMRFQNDDQPLFGMFFGGAAMVNGINYCREHIYPLNLPTTISHALAIGSLIIASFGGGKNASSPLHSGHQVVDMPGAGRLEGRFVTVVATTLNKLLLGWRPYGREGVGTIGFSAVEHSPGALFRAIKGLITGRFGKSSIEGVNTRRVNEIRITGDEPVTLDGEVYKVKPGETVTLKGGRSLSFVSMR